MKAVVVFRVFALKAGERVSCRSQANDRLARLQIILDVLHLIVRQSAEARQDDHQIGFVERLKAGNVVVLVRIDIAGLWIDLE